jgi:hypothetical protein
MDDTRNLDELRAKYRRVWDLHPFIANQEHAKCRQVSSRPTNNW